MTDSLIMEAILAMDAYNQGYSPQIFGVGTQIGDATLSQGSDVNPASASVAAGFYAVAYNWNGYTVISYRGTDNIGGGVDNGGIVTGGDLWNGWTNGGGYYAALQAGLAIQFYRGAKKAGALAGYVIANDNARLWQEAAA
jgi:hypothetical protein